MVISARRPGPSLSARAIDVAFSRDRLAVFLEDGRRISVPIVWFPRLSEATLQQRQRWRLVGHGIGIRWDEVDEDISVAGLLATSDNEVLTPVAPTLSSPEHPVPAAKPGPERHSRRPGKKQNMVTRDKSGR